MSSTPLQMELRSLTRRELLRRSGLGFGLLVPPGVPASDGVLPAAATDANPLAPKQPHFPAKAKRVVHLFMNGGPSHVDTFDPKPALQRYANKPLSGLPGESSFG